jgi:hypothetical protein
VEAEKVAERNNITSNSRGGKPRVSFTSCHQAAPSRS